MRVFPIARAASEASAILEKTAAMRAVIVSIQCRADVASGIQAIP